LNQHAAAVASLWIRPDRAAMVEIQQYLKAHINERVRLEIVHVRDEADAAGVVLVCGRIKSLCWRQARIPEGGGKVRSRHLLAFKTSKIVPRAPPAPQRTAPGCPALSAKNLPPGKEGSHSRRRMPQLGFARTRHAGQKCPSPNGQQHCPRDGSTVPRMKDYRFRERPQVWKIAFSKPLLLQSRGYEATIRA